MIIYTKLDANGNLVIDHSKGDNGKVLQKAIRVYALEEDPLAWADEVNKNTDKKNEDFTRQFLKDNDLSFDNMAKVRSWLPYYYVSLLLNTCHCINEAGIDNVKMSLLNWCEKAFAKNNVVRKQFQDIVNSIPDFDKNTTVGKISDAINPLTAFGFLMIAMERF